MFLIIIKLYKPRTTASRFESRSRHFRCGFFSSNIDYLCKDLFVNKRLK